MQFNKEMKLAQTVVKKSGKILLEYFRQESLARYAKIGKDFATEADLASEKLIVDMILKRFPDHNILAEEGGNHNRDSNYLWLIDPLDGTLNFASGLQTWATMVALQYQGKIVLSVIYLPFLKDFCTVQQDKGTYINGKRVMMTGGSDVDSWVYFCGIRSYNKPKTKRIFQKTRNLTSNISMIGSIGAGGIFLASNRIDAIIADWNNPWDMAPAYLTIKEAGGTITDFSGKPWTLSSESFMASRPKIHPTLMKLTK